MKSGRYNVRELLTHNEIEQIIIPEIQRDYVWKKKNVVKLLDSIIKNFVSKRESNLLIEIVGETNVNASVSSFLQKEYNKLIHNTKVGFIYAYHDNEYPGKFFLIDGQQRFTTIYLLILAIYIKNKKNSDFKTIYFKNEILKIDYKVREHSHEFMSYFIKNELDSNSCDIMTSIKYYKNDYEKDETINNLISNYRTINSILDENLEIIKNNSTYDDFIEYIEDYIEVNYFDTNISEQGEQLYLYMNSRGEFLSHQEKIKSEIVKKENELATKKEIGGKWEQWQNFFWIHRGLRTENGNENADIGFEEFLKWCSILHICTSENIEKNIVFERINGKKQTLKEAKENYINRAKDKVDVQKEYLSKYQIDNLTGEFISKNFDAILFLSKLDLKYIPISLNWFFNIERALNYVQLLPLVYFISNTNWIDEEQKIADIRSLAMLLKSETYFLSVSKNPDNATIDAIELVKSMVEDGETDITYFLNQKFSERFKTLLNPFILEQLKLLSESKNRGDLENVMWKITLNKNLNQFLNGNTSILYRTVEFYMQNNSCEYEFHDILEKFYSILIKVLREYDVYKNGAKSDIFRRSLLIFGDYSVETYGSYRFGNRIEGYSFGFSDNGDNIEMNEIFQSDNLHLVKMLIVLYEKPEINLVSLIKAYESEGKDDWKEVFIKNSYLLSYCRKKRILFENEKRILLISEKDKGYVEVQCKLLENIYKKYNMRIEKHNICVIDFDVMNMELISQGNSYALDLVYFKKEWKYLIYCLNNDTENKLKPFVDLNLGIIDGNKLLPFNDLVFKDDENSSIIENINQLCLKLNDLLKIIVNSLSA